jgi:hypothetical protein
VLRLVFGLAVQHEVLSRNLMCIARAVASLSVASTMSACWGNSSALPVASDRMNAAGRSLSSRAAGMVNRTWCTRVNATSWLLRRSVGRR